MDPISATIGAGASIYGAGRQNYANAKEAARNRRFQRQMSNTAVRRRVRDMKKAGINPMLAVGSSGGAFQAATPQGAQARMENVFDDSVSDAAKAWTTAFQAKLAKKELKLKDAQIHNIDSQANLNDTTAAKVAQDTEIDMSPARIGKREQELDETWSRARLQKFKGDLIWEKEKLLKVQATSAPAEARLRKRRAEIDTQLLGVDALLNRAKGAPLRYRKPKYKYRGYR